jgi:hypothetical protein
MIVFAVFTGDAIRYGVDGERAQFPESVLAPHHLSSRRLRRLLRGLVCAALRGRRDRESLGQSRLAW